MGRRKISVGRGDTLVLRVCRPLPPENQQRKEVLAYVGFVFCERKERRRERVAELACCRRRKRARPFLLAPVRSRHAVGIGTVPQ